MATNETCGWAFNFFPFLKKKKSLVVLEYIQCPAFVLLLVSGCMWCGLCHTGRGFNVILAPLAASHHIRSSSQAGACLSGCLCVYMCVLALAAFSLPPSLPFCSLCPSLHAYPSSTRRKWTPLKKRHPSWLPSKSTRGQTVLVWHNRGTLFVLLWCSQFKQRMESGGRVSGEKVGKTGGERKAGWERDEVERTKWESARRQICVCACVCVYRGHKSKGGNGSAESAFYSLQLLT